MKWFVYGLVSWVVVSSSVAMAGSDDFCPGWTRYESYQEALDAARVALKARAAKGCSATLKLEEFENYEGINDHAALQTWKNKMVAKCVSEENVSTQEFNFKIVNTTDGCTLNERRSDEFGYFLVGVDEIPTPAAAAQARRVKSERRDKSL